MNIDSYETNYVKQFNNNAQDKPNTYFSADMKANYFPLDLVKMRNILLVDDNERSQRIIRSGVKLLLPRNNLVIASSMQEALAIVASEQNIGCAIIDDHFPRTENGLVGPHGEELFDHVKARWPRAKIIAHAWTKFDINRPYDAYVRRQQCSELEVLQRLGEFL